ncbi:MAG: isoprenyl transferase [Flavobacteriaceae bacterium]|jgi:undecaprenyl diphosphate synthase
MKKTPKHIAIIMDGNGRWAKKRGMQRILGHRNGIKAVSNTVEAAAEMGIDYLTLFAFSSENWSRPKEEINLLMKLLVASLHEEFEKLVENNIRLEAIGNLTNLPTAVHQELNSVIQQTANNTGMVLTLALSYGAKEEIALACQQIAEKVKNSLISPEKIDQSTINEHLYTRNLPTVDLLIRTSGEQRLSNFLLWQIAYAELYFTDVLWPDFGKNDLQDAISNYQKRERRFGKTSEQLSS